MSGTYTTIAGDMWDSIAYKKYGSEKYADALINANLSHRDTFIFSAGVVLTVPDVDSDTASSSLPPWKQVSG